MMRLERVGLDLLRPYQNNPRYNDDAIDAVEESIDQVGYISPIIVDESLQILAGHSRWRSLNELGEEEIDVVVVDGLTDEQKRKFRLLDNKTAEIASWDLGKLQQELDNLDFEGYDFWSEELEKMADKIVAEKPKKKVIVCPMCGKVVSGLVDMDRFDK